MKIIRALESDDGGQELRLVPHGNTDAPAKAASCFVLGPIGAHRGSAFHLATAFFALVTVLGHGEPVRAVAAPQLGVGLAPDDALLVRRAGAVVALAHAGRRAARERQSQHEKTAQHAPRIPCRSTSGERKST